MVKLCVVVSEGETVISAGGRVGVSVLLVTVELSVPSMSLLVSVTSEVLLELEVAEVELIAAKEDSVLLWEVEVLTGRAVVLDMLGLLLTVEVLLVPVEEALPVALVVKPPFVLLLVSLLLLLLLLPVSVLLAEPTLGVLG